MPIANIYSDILASATERPDAPAVIVDGNSPLTYRELLERSERIATELKKAGAGPDHIVSLYAGMSEDAIASALAIMAIGAVFTAAHHSFTARFYRRHLEDSGARFAISDTDLSQEPDLGSFLTKCSGDDGDLGLYMTASPGPDAPGSRDIGAIFYTSGSSGRPKGVAIAGSAMSAAVESVTSYMDFQPGDRVLSFSALGSDFGFYSVFMPLVKGACVIARSGPFESEDEAVRYCMSNSVTVINTFPPYLEDIAGKTPGVGTLPDVRLICSSGQRLRGNLVPSLRKRFPAARIHSSYGLTECKRVSYLPDGELETHHESVGRPVAAVRAYILDAYRDELTVAGDIGELALAGDMLMDCYWNDAEATSDVILPDHLGEKRMFLTGDMFHRDEQGRLYYHHRKDGTFTRKGFQVNPSDIERAVRLHPAVNDALVVAMEDPYEGAVPVLIVVPEDSRAGDEALVFEIRDFCQSRLERHMWPLHILPVDRLARKMNGKTDYAEMKAIVHKELNRMAKEITR